MPTRIKGFICAIYYLSVILVQAQLLVSVSPPKTTGNKTLVKTEMVNRLPETVESARAVCFLLDEKGKVVGQSVQWVLGNSKNRPPLKPGKTNIFHFVIDADKLASTNLTAKIIFNRVILEAGKLANPAKDVQIQNNGIKRL